MSNVDCGLWTVECFVHWTMAVAEKIKTVLSVGSNGTNAGILAKPNMLQNCLHSQQYVNKAKPRKFIDSTTTSSTISIHDLTSSAALPLHQLRKRGTYRETYFHVEIIEARHARTDLLFNTRPKYCTVVCDY